MLLLLPSLPLREVATMRIHIVAPKNPPSFWTYDRILSTLGKRCLCPNLALPTVAALTPPDHQVTLCDENVEAIDFDVEADIIGVTGYLVHRPRMFEILEEFRRRGRFVVAGGPFASLCPDQFQERCDVLFVGETEQTWPRFLSEFERGCWKTEYRAEKFVELAHVPVPRFDLLRVDRYHMLPIQVGRGCPFRCEFCDVIVLYGRRPRTKTIAGVMREIEECHRLGARQIFLVDDNFIGNQRHAKALLRELAAWQQQRGYPLEFNTEVSLNAARDEELLELLRSACFTTLFIGIESPRRSSLREVGKVQNTRGDLVESVRTIQRFGIQVQAGMIVGFDHDDPSVFAEHLAFVREARIPVSMTGMLQALPETPLHARVAEEGRLLSQSTGDQFVFSNVLPKGMSLVQLYRGYRDLLRALYGYRSFHERTLGFLRERGRAAGPKVLARREELALFVRILRDTVLRASPRRAWFTLSLLGRTLLRRPSAFRDAVAFAVIHKGLAAYVDEISQHLTQLIAAFEAGGPEFPAVGRSD
jgi:radical SAM superfamily enzyme YgiQ (UPF0313 family)